ncbi:MAG: 50S ribosomal protein L31 [Actinomycetia bacterium]|nr:50S ribosomal protein L31 [Actinomycetes bacterium]
MRAGRCSSTRLPSHPVGTETQRVLDSAGQVEKFRRRYGQR